MKFNLLPSRLLSCLLHHLSKVAQGIEFLLAVSIVGAPFCFAQGTLDQANAPLSWTGGANNIVPANFTEQSFTTSLGCLTRVDVGLMTGNRGRGGDKLTLKILDWSNRSAPKELASVSASIPEGFDGFWAFTLPGTGVTVPTAAGAVAILLQDTGKNVFWWKYQGRNPYPKGDRYFFGQSTSDDYLFKTYGAASCPGFSLTVVPDPVNLTPGGRQQITIGFVRQGGFTGPVAVTFSLPSGITAVPTTLTISGTNGSSTLAASVAAPAGSFTGTANGSASGVLGVQQSFGIKVAAPPGPRITSVTPSVQQKGGSLTVAGSGFDANCGSNMLSFAGVNVVPNTCTAGSLTANVPPQATYGTINLAVTSAGRPSNALAFKVGRQFGNFVDITGDILSQHTSRTCSSAGSVKLNVESGGGDYYTASFQQTAGGSSIGSSIPFFVDYWWYSSNTKNIVGNVGGAGFSLCTVGVVFNANDGSGPRLVLRDLQQKGDFRDSPYALEISVPGLPSPYSEQYRPHFLRSPDGTIILAVTASRPLSPGNLTAAFFDKVASGRIIKSVPLDRDPAKGTYVSGYSISATLSSANEIVLTFGSRTLSPISIP